MKPILILAKNPDTYFIKRLIEEVGVSACTLYDPWSKEQFTASYSLCFVRTSGVYGGNDNDLHFLGRFSGRAVNSLDALRLFRRKSSQYKFYESQGISSLPWLDLKDVSTSHLKRWTSHHPKKNYLIKPDRGQGGRGIEVHSQENLELFIELKRKQNDLDYVVQPYLMEGEEYRIFFYDKERVCLKRESLSSFKGANFTQGGKATLSQIPLEALEVVETLIQKSGAFYGAIDLLVDDDGPYVLELNSVPGIEQLEQVTGRNIMEEMLNKLDI